MLIHSSIYSFVNLLVCSFIHSCPHFSIRHIIILVITPLSTQSQNTQHITIHNLLLITFDYSGSFMVERAADIAEAMEVHVKKLTANANRKQVGYCVLLIVVMIVMMSHSVFEFIIVN
jgi:hypothetical protein